MKLWFIQDNLAMGDNADMFVAAMTGKRAIELWRIAFEVEGDPEFICEVPAMGQVERVIPWLETQFCKLGGSTLCDL